MNSDDRGATWSEVSLDEDLLFTTIRFLDENNAFLLGEFGAVVRTADGGLNHLGTNDLFGVSLWLDSLFMFGNLLARWGEREDDARALDDAWMYDGYYWSDLPPMSTVRDRPACTLVQLQNGDINLLVGLLGRSFRNG